MEKSSGLGMRLALLTMPTLFAVGACGGAVITQEDEIRAFVGEIERASRERDLRLMKDAVSEQYADPRGRTREDLHGLLTYHYFRNRSIYVLLRIEKLELQSPDAASLVLLAALAGGPISSPQALRELRADVYRFELELEDEGEADWRVRSAGWRPAQIDDFF